MIKSILAAALLLLIVVTIYLSFGGIRITVKNVGTQKISDVSVNVTGNTYSLGDLEPGERRSVQVVPKGESGVRLTFKTPADEAIETISVGYFENGPYRGTISLETDGLSDQFVRVEDTIRLGL